MPSKHLALSLLSLLELSSAYLQLDFEKRRVGLSELHPAVRSRYLRRDLQRRAGTVTATLDNAQNNLLYLVNVTIGSDDQRLSLQLDTGSSDIWVPWADSDICSTLDDLCSEGGAYDPSTSSSFQDVDPDQFRISYVDGTEIEGDYFVDTFGIGGVSVNDQTMGLAKDATVQSDTAPFQGIIGVGFPSGESLVAQGGDQYPNIINSLKNQGHIRRMAYSLWLNDLEAQTGSILFGGVDKSKYSGDLTILPIQLDEDSGAKTSFTVELDTLNVVAGDGKSQYRQRNLAMPVILDSGTTLTYLPDDIASAIANGVGAASDGSSGLYVPCDLMNSPVNFEFTFGGPNGPTIAVQMNEFVLPYPPQPSGQVPTLEDGTEICQWGILGSGSDPNLFGDTFLRSAYVVYDIDSEIIGIAPTVFNVSSSDSDIVEITGRQLPGATSTAGGTAAAPTATGATDEPSVPSEATPTSPGEEQTATFDVGGTRTGGAAGGNSSPSTSQDAAAGIAIPPTSTLIGAATFALMAVSGFSGALMILL